MSAPLAILAQRLLRAPFSLMADRMMSPLEQWTNPGSFPIALPTVPLPQPGGPKSKMPERGGLIFDGRAGREVFGRKGPLGLAPWDGSKESFWAPVAQAAA
jgi:hypothetical protein